MLAPIGAMLIQFAVSRQREYEADRVGAEILGRPMPLANALRRLDALAHRIPMQVAPAAAPLAQVNPLAARGGGSAVCSAPTRPPKSGCTGSKRWRGPVNGPSRPRRLAGLHRPRVALLVLDLGVLNRRSHVLSFKEAMSWSLGLIAFALLFGGFIWWREGSQPALEYYTGYLIELSLSVDNLFVFILIFSYFGVPAEAQPKVLKWGILGAIVMRFIMILLGALLFSALRVDHLPVRRHPDAHRDPHAVPEGRSDRAREESHRPPGPAGAAIHRARTTGANFTCRTSRGRASLATRCPGAAGG